MSKEEREYTPADICRFFGLSRTTLFRWEDQGEITAAKRDKKGQRIYKREHLLAIAERVRNKLKEEIRNVYKYHPDDQYATLEMLEQLYRVELLQEQEPLEAIRNLRALVKRRRKNHLSSEAPDEPVELLHSETIDLLIEIARSRPRGDKVRKAVWDLLRQYENDDQQ